MASAIVFERSVFELNADEPASFDAFFAIGFGSYAPGPGVGSLRSFCICFRAASAAARLAGPESYAAEREVRVVLYVLRALGGLLKRPARTPGLSKSFFRSRSQSSVFVLDSSLLNTAQATFSLTRVSIPQIQASTR